MHPLIQLQRESVIGSSMPRTTTFSSNVASIFPPLSTQSKPGDSYSISMHDFYQPTRQDIVYTSPVSSPTSASGNESSFHIGTDSTPPLSMKSPLSATLPFPWHVTSHEDSDNTFNFSTSIPHLGNDTHTFQLEGFSTLFAMPSDPFDLHTASSSLEASPTLPPVKVLPVEDSNPPPRKKLRTADGSAAIPQVKRSACVQCRKLKVDLRLRSKFVY